MGYRHILVVCATVLCLQCVPVRSQGGTVVESRALSRFSCRGRASGYYADTETGCQVYHMCDGLGRQFSYKCPNMTLFQQRMLICDHWYMVNCSMSEQNYDANLLIGQRDKPFVSDDEMRLRTPRPDILSAPPYNPYYDLLRTEVKNPAYSSNSIVGFDDVIGDVDNDLEVANVNYQPPASWSAGKNRRYGNKINENDGKETVALEEAASQEPDASFQPTPRGNITNKLAPKVKPPPIELIPPLAPITEDTKSNDGTNKTADESTFQFIKRFDPSSTDFTQTAMTKSEILDINDQLPLGQASSEEERTPRKFKNFGNNLNTFKTENDKNFNEESKFNSINTKGSTPVPIETNSVKGIPEPEKVLLPPKTEFSELPSTTVGPPIYYDWKWAVPAFDLIPPSEGDKKNVSSTPQTRSIQSENPFVRVTRPEPKTTTPEPRIVEYNISSYFVPDYVFPLDKAHPGYDNDEAQTSFQVQVGRPGQNSYGENPECPQCHPAYLKPGTCEPCIVKR